MKFEDSQTAQNVKKAFMRESAAFMEYFFYAEQAKTDGFEQIKRIFNETADNEMAHAKVWFKLYHAIFSTKDNLLNSADLEKYEYSQMYNEFSKIAEKEGFPDIAEKFTNIGKVEKAHEKRFLNLAEQVKNKTVFEKEKPVIWRCANCGHIITAFDPPEVCPVCSHPKAYFFVPNEKI